MLSEDFFALRRFLENEFNTKNRIELTFEQSSFVINKLYALEDQTLMLENAVVPECEREAPVIIEAENVIRMDRWTATHRRGAKS